MRAGGGRTTVPPMARAYSSPSVPWAKGTDLPAVHTEVVLGGHLAVLDLQGAQGAVAVVAVDVLALEVRDGLAAVDVAAGDRAKGG